MKRLSVTAPNERRRRDQVAGTREGETERGDGPRASEGWEHQAQGKVDEREKERGKLRESGEERGEQRRKRRTAQQIRPSSIPLTAAVIQAGRGSLAHQEKTTKIQEITFFFFLFLFLWVKKKKKTVWRGTRRKRNQRASAASEMDSDSGEQSDGDLCPGKTNMQPQHQLLSTHIEVSVFPEGQ